MVGMSDGGLTVVYPLPRSEDRDRGLPRRMLVGEAQAAGYQWGLPLEGVTYFNFYLILITIASRQIAENLVEIRS